MFQIKLNDNTLIAEATTFERANYVAKALAATYVMGRNTFIVIKDDQIIAEYKGHVVNYPKGN